MRGTVRTRRSIRNLAVLAAGFGVLTGCANEPKTTTAPGAGLADARAAQADPRTVLTVDEAPSAGAGAQDVVTEPAGGLDWAAQAERDAEDWARLMAERRDRPDVRPAPTGPIESVASTPVVPAPPAAPVIEAPLARDPAPPVPLAAPPPFDPPGSLDPIPPRPAAPSTPESLETLLEGAYEALTANAALDDAVVRELLLHAAGALRDPDRGAAEAATPLGGAERTALSAFQRFMADLGRRLDHDAARTAVESSVVDLIAARFPAALRLPRAALCWRVEGFGSIDRFEPYRWLAGIENVVLVYLEVAGFQSEQGVDDQWTTTVSQALEIYADADGALVWKQAWQPAVDTSAQRRREFFTTQRITLPPALSVGNYHLKIRARDDLSGAIAETSIPFSMVADPGMAARIGK